MAVAAFVIAMVALAGLALVLLRAGTSPPAAEDARTAALEERLDELEERLGDLEAARGVEALRRAAARRPG